MGNMYKACQSCCGSEYLQQNQSYIDSLQVKEQRLSQYNEQYSSTFQQNKILQISTQSLGQSSDVNDSQTIVKRNRSESIANQSAKLKQNTPQSKLQQSYCRKSIEQRDSLQKDEIEKQEYQSVQICLN